MTSERWHRVAELVDAALARDERQRASFVRDACAGDETLRQEVLSLLDRQNGADAFLERPAFDALVNASAGDRVHARPGRQRADHVSGSRVPWWIHLVAGSFIGYFGLIIFSVYYRPLTDGLLVRTLGADNLIVASVSAGSDADRAGVRPGDRVEAIDGARLRTLRDYLAFNASASLGDAQTYLIERSGRRFFVPLSPQRLARSPALRYLPIFIGLFASLVLALVVVYRRPDDRVARIGALLLASIACSSVAEWPEGLAGTWRHLPVIIGMLLWPACLSTIAVGPIAFAFFALFPRPIIRRRWVWVAALIPGAIVTAWAGTYFVLVVYRPDLSVALFRPDWFTIAGPLSFPAYFGVGVVMLLSNYRQSADLTDRRRVRVLLWGLAVAAVEGLWYVVVVMVLAERGRRIAFSEPARLIGGMLFIALPCSFAYAIVAQRLFDIRILVRQGLRYALARRSIISLLPATTAALVVDLLMHAERPLLDIIRERGWLYAALGAFAAIAYRNRERWIALLDRRFFRERYDAGKILTGVIEGIRRAGSLETVATLAVTRLSAAFHSSYVTLMVSEPRQRGFHPLALAPDIRTVPRIVPHLTRDSTLVGLTRAMGKPIDFCNPPGWLADQLSREDADVIRTADVGLVAPIVTAGADRREALLVFGAKRSEEPYTRDDRELVVAVAEGLATLFQAAGSEDAADNVFAECPQCGVCDAIHVTRCREDGTLLARIGMPRVLGNRYRILRRLGRGGMGAVYEARDDELQRHVAVKFIRDEVVGQRHAVDRFRREALVAASFAHPNVVTVYDFGVAGNAHGYLVMELLVGTTVGEALRRDGRFTPTRMLQIMRGVCHAVEAAHRRQLVHRDLKPDNIFLADEAAKVLDFGIATFVQPAADSAPLTATGAIIGTRRYMSPEQARGGAPSPSWDVWALAVVAYEMLGGDRLSGDTSVDDSGSPAVTRASFHLSDRQPALPPSIDALFARAFSLDPSQRQSGALDLMRDLEQAFGGDVEMS